MQELARACQKEGLLPLVFTVNTLFELAVQRGEELLINSTSPDSFHWALKNRPEEFDSGMAPGNMQRRYYWLKLSDPELVRCASAGWKEHRLMGRQQQLPQCADITLAVHTHSLTLTALHACAALPAPSPAGRRCSSSTPAPPWRSPSCPRS